MGWDGVVRGTLPAIVEETDFVRALWVSVVSYPEKERERGRGELCDPVRKFGVDKCEDAKDA